jgi:hypothetical protein
MEMNFFVLIIGIITLILYLFFETWGHYEFIPFVYKFGIIIKKITLKIETKAFTGLESNFYKINNINYKFISENICLARLGSKEMPFIAYFKPIPPFSYLIKNKNNKYIISIKISFLYIIIIGFFLYEYIKIILNHQKIKFNDLFGLIIYLLIFIFFIIFSIFKLKDVEKHFIQIIGNKK